MSPGCRGVELYCSTADASILFTISEWEAESDLEAYRQSGLFSATWKRTKPLFSQPAEAWSLETLY